MNLHSSAKTCPASRALLVNRVLERGWPVIEAAYSAGISLRRAYVWSHGSRRKVCKDSRTAPASPAECPGAMP